MKFANYSLFAYDLRTQGFEYAVEHTQKIGFDAVEWMAYYKSQSPFINDLNKAKEVKKYLHSRGLSVSCYSMVADLTVEDSALSIDTMLRNVEYASELESPYFHHTVIPDINCFAERLSYYDALETVFDKAVRIAEHCKKHSIVCLYEPQGYYINGLDGLSVFFDKVKNKCSAVGICADTGNSLFVDTPPYDIFKKFSADIKHVHIKDYVIEEQGIEECSQRSVSGKCICDVLPGEGCVNFAEIFEQIRGYSGDISMEIICDDEQMVKSIEYIREFIK